MLSLFICSFLLMAASACSLVFLLLRPEMSEKPVERLEQLTRNVRRRERVDGSDEQLSNHGFAAALRSRFSRLDREQIRRQFLQAGWRSQQATDLYMAARILLPAAGVLLAFVLPGPHMLWAFIVPVLLYVGLSFFLNGRIKKRRKALGRAIPDMLDLLVICVEAGLGIDQALLRVAMESSLTHPELHEELMQIVREQRAGKPRQEAWKEAIDRLEVPELEAFMNMMLQSERFGTPIAQALRTYAVGVHQKRVQSAEEKAAKTTIKIIFPLAIFSFPSIFIVLLGPAALNLIRSF